MASEPQLISVTTVVSLLAVVAILFTAYAVSARLLTRNATNKTRVFFVWHLFDALIHFCLEGSYLYNCFFSSAELSTLIGVSGSGLFAVRMTPPEVFFLGKSESLYGAFYGTSPTAKLWQEYAKADRRWGGVDLNIVSLELLTVFVMGPLAIYVCYLLWKRDNARAMWWMTVIAVSELYGGWMTFAPEWLSASTNLDTSNFMYLWVYLFFFNTLWVWVPLWILWESYRTFSIPATAARLKKEL